MGFLLCTLYAPYSFFRQQHYTPDPGLILTEPNR